VSTTSAAALRAPGCILLILAAAFAACAEERPAQDAPANADSVARTDTVIAEPVIIYVLATDSAIDALRQEVPADDFFVIADDLMWYRATAIEHLDSLPHTLREITGRRPMVFRVAGVPRSYDFRDVELLDFVIFYDTDREPRIVAPVDVHDVVAEFFGTTGG
jgi:hypothetical protein